LIDDGDGAGLAGWLAQRANDEALSEERMGRIRDFDLVRFWVLDMGIKGWALLTIWIGNWS
jgi:hypothetical protein